MHVILRSEAKQLGLKRYYTGKACKHGHVAERYVIKSTCVQCLTIRCTITHKEQKNACDRKRYHSLSPEKLAKERTRLREFNRKKYWENPELLRKKAREFQAANPEKTKARLEAWKKISQSKIKKYRQRPYVKEQAKFLAGRRRAIKLQAIPIWADLELIELIYENCPVSLHVDHIVPLVSKFVCGLHCEANLRYLTPFENMSKGNRHWPDMP